MYGEQLADGNQPPEPATHNCHRAYVARHAFARIKTYCLKYIQRLPQSRNRNTSLTRSSLDGISNKHGAEQTYNTTIVCNETHFAHTVH